MKIAILEAGKAIELLDEIEAQIAEAAANSAQVVQALTAKQPEPAQAQA